MLSCILVSCQGEQGIQGEKGEKCDDGLTPTIEINDEGYWVINGVVTDVKARGEDGKDASVDNENSQGLAFFLKEDGTYAVGVGNAIYFSKISLPTTYKGKLVTEIAYSGFLISPNGTNLLKEIELPNGLTTISEWAFGRCQGLTSIVIPDSVNSIGDSAFSYCKNLTFVVIGDGVTSIGDAAFYGCDKLTDVYYAGTEEEWTEINVGIYNFSNATIHYNYIFEK